MYPPTAPPDTTAGVDERPGPDDRLHTLLTEVAELTGQRNAIDGRLVEIFAEISRDNLCGHTGVRSISHLIAWKTGTSPANAATMATIAERTDTFPRCTQALREGRLSLDQVGVIAERAADGSDDHYAQLATVATVAQLRTAIKLAPRPDRKPHPDPQPTITKTRTTPDYDHWRITLPHTESATFQAALQSHLDALITAWKHDHHPDDTDSDSTGTGGGHHPYQRPPMPTTIDAFLHLIEAGWDADAHRRPHSHRTTVIVHLDIKDKIADLHLGPILTDADRQYLTCDATCETWFEHAGQPIGAGRTTRTISRRLRRALEHRHPTCAVPGCATTRGLHAHHLKHWEDGGETELHNLILICPYHHRLHHRGLITITGPTDNLTVTDDEGDPLDPGSLAHPPTTPPPTVNPYPGPTGEKADWWWYTPYQPQPPPPDN